MMERDTTTKKTCHAYTMEVQGSWSQTREAVSKSGKRGKPNHVFGSRLSRPTEAKVWSHVRDILMFSTYANYPPPPPAQVVRQLEHTDLGERGYRFDLNDDEFLLF